MCVCPQNDFVVNVAECVWGVVYLSLDYLKFTLQSTADLVSGLCTHLLSHLFIANPVS